VQRGGTRKLPANFGFGLGEENSNASRIPNSSIFRPKKFSSWRAAIKAEQNAFAEAAKNRSQQVSVSIQAIQHEHPAPDKLISMPQDLDKIRIRSGQHLVNIPSEIRAKVKTLRNTCAHVVRIDGHLAR
jgi:hypothetical protein